MHKGLGNFLKKPMADVHNHFHLGGSKQLFFKKYPNSKISFPNTYDGLPGMIDFIYTHLNKHLTTPEDVKNFMQISIESAIKSNISYLEASVDTNLARFFNDDIHAVITKVKHLVDTYKYEIEFRPEIGINKDLDIKKAYLFAEKCIESGVFYSIDLYGQEANQNLKPFVDLYKIAKENNLKTKVHIGEFSDAESIKETILTLHPDELQHGINAIESEYVLDMILERNIRLNICPESNVMLGAVQNLTTHPIKKLFDKGIKVTVNTDDLILFHKTNAEQFRDLYEANLFSLDELELIRQNAF